MLHKRGETISRVLAEIARKQDGKRIVYFFCVTFWRNNDKEAEEVHELFISLSNIICKENISNFRLLHQILYVLCGCCFCFRFQSIA